MLLMEKAKLVVEGAGAVGAAALLGGKTGAAPKRDHRRWCSAAATSTPACSPRSPAATRRWPAAGSSSSPASRDRPGSLAQLLACVGDTGANLVEVQHMREGVDLHVRQTAVQLVLETRGREHAAAGPRGDPRRGLRDRLATPA